jgi:glycosyltransferase involved in cell wall biosynthesis
VSHSLDPARGGPSAVAVRLAAAQAGLGHEVSILTYLPPDAEERLWAASEAIPGFENLVIHRIGRLTGLERFWPRRARRKLGTLVPASDVLHLHGLWKPLLPVAAAVARKRGKPYVLTPHGMLDPWSLAQNRIVKRVALRLVHRRMINGAAFVHALNSDERDLIGPLELKAPVEILPNGVFLDEIDPLPEPGAFAAAHPELDGRPYVLFLSRLHYKKGLDYLADAFARLPAAGDVRLVVAGPDDGAEAAFRRRVAELGIGRRVHMVGPLYGRDKLAALAGAACFCLPSRQEGFSVAIIEALACGVPAVVSEACHFPEVAEAGAGLVVPLEAGAVARGLETVLRNPDAGRAMGAAGRRLVEERFTWPAIAGRCIAAYKAHGAAGAADRAGSVAR